MCECETREIYTISVDSKFASAPNSDNSFVVYLNSPLRNVVRAELLSASIGSTASSNVIYVHIQELVTKFNDHAPLQYTVSSAGNTSNVGTVSQLQSNISFISEAFAVIHTPRTTSRQYFHRQADYEASSVYIDPIRTLDKLTVKLYDGSGDALSTEAPTFLLFRFECAKNNRCLY